MESAIWGNTTMVILKLLAEEDMYGYQIINEIMKKSDNIFNLKAGTLYPILHGLEKDDMVTSYDETAENQRVRKYYKITSKGKNLLYEKESECMTYMHALNRLMGWGEEHATT